jgi:release factor glutamine methyltransferase
VTKGGFEVEGLRIEAPAGVYQPHADSSSRLYIRNILALPPKSLNKVWDLGCGSGVIGLFLAARFGSDVLATDLSPNAIAATNANARTNHLPIRTRLMEMFAGAEERDFDLIVFNSPLIDALPGSGWDEDTMCDPGGAILVSFANEVDQYLAPSAIALTGFCCNSAYERLDGLATDMWIVGIEMAGNGFWRAILGLKKASR